MKLSIIIPVYNSVNYITKSFEKLKSVYNKINEDEFEIIFVNDGSTDDSGILLEDLKLKRKNIKVIHQENQGSSGARNSGIDIAQGEYIQFLDSDDYIDWDKIIPLLNIANDENLEAISYRLDYINENGSVLGVRPIQSVPHDIVISGSQALIAGFNPSSICLYLFKRKFLNQHRLRITPKITHMDVEFTSRFMMVANRVMFKNVVAYHYLQSENSITRPSSLKKTKKLLSDEIIVAKLVKNNIYNTSDSKLKIAIQKNYNSIIWGLIWRFLKNKNEVPYKFKIECIDKMKKDGLYPISGPLKTKFQKITRVFFNQEFLLKKTFKN